MKRCTILIALAAIAICMFSCQKENKISPSTNNQLAGKTMETVSITGSLKSISMQDKQESMPFKIFYAGVSGENVSMVLCFNRTEQVSKFSTVWNGKYEVKDDSTFVNLMLVRENTGALLKEVAYDSTYVNLAKIGVQVEKLRQHKTAVKVYNASDASTVAYIKLNNGYGTWPIY